MFLKSIVAASQRRADEIPDRRRREAVDGPTSRPRSFRDAIAGRERLSLIAEWKRHSPSRGPMPLRLDLEAQLRAYEDGGAAALSVLTEPDQFGGSLDDLRRASASSRLPILRKDFLVDPRQVIEAAHCGASAALLIVRVLDRGALAECVAACEECRIDALIESHDERELACALGFDHAILGVNNRDLDSLRLEPTRALRLLPRVPSDRIVVAESGYRSAGDVAPLLGLADAVLVGHALLDGVAPTSFLHSGRVEP
ncbi:MAG: indole-3-glycerol-phosphate synthase [Planctomycetes bacterium]|nr:indole-3-glycerol-phosphate synthase [Planctomycetota bacterium]